VFRFLLARLNSEFGDIPGFRPAFPELLDQPPVLDNNLSTNNKNKKTMYGERRMGERVEKSVVLLGDEGDVKGVELKAVDLLVAKETSGDLAVEIAVIGRVRERDRLVYRQAGEEEKENI